jgi:Spy/CpxP family protein refolding chaperone
MRNVVRIAALVACALALPGGLAAQKTVTITGKVTSEGPPGAVAGANVYINDLALSALTDTAGKYTLSATDSSSPSLRRHFARSDTGVIVRVRVRAVGFAPQSRDTRLVPGSAVVMDFRLIPQPVTQEIPTGVERARVPYAVARSGQSANIEVPGNADPFMRYLFTPEQVMQHQGALELQESQRKALQDAVAQTQNRISSIQWALAQEGEKLAKLLNATSLNESEVLAQVDRIIAAEREIKRAHMTLMIKIKNTLTAAQQERLRSLRE